MIEKPPMTVVGIECRTSNSADAAPLDIPRLWSQFYQENRIEQIPHKSSDEIIALYCDYEGDYTKPYTFVLGCPVSQVESIPQGMVVKTIPHASYSPFRAVGEFPQSLIETWGQIWQSDLKRTYTYDYEVYGRDFFLKEPKEVELFIAIEN